MKTIPTPELITPEMRDIFMALRKAKNDYESENLDAQVANPSDNSFIVWLNETYGIQLCLSKDGYNLSKDIEISDEKKYMFFVLKYKS